MTVNPPESSKSVVARYFDMWNTGDTSAIEQILAPQWVDHAHPEVTGPDGIRQAIEKIRSVRPELHFDIEALLGEDDLVAVIGSVSPSPQTDGSSRLIWLVQLTNGRMTQMRTYHEDQP